MSYKLRILSLGAGVQSSTLYLMAECGEIEPFHCAIFADTGWEKQETYQHLEWLKQIGRTPIITVRQEMSLYDHSMQAGFGCSQILSTGMCLPAFFVDDMSRQGMSKRQCTDTFKIKPIRKETRRLLGLQPRQRAPKGAVQQCVGISLDEAQRMKPGRERRTVLSYPLVEQGMTRWDCQQWLARNYGGLVVPKSSCVGCPFHSNREWWDVRQNEAEWKQVIMLDNRIRSIEGFRGNLFLHRSCRPLEEVDLSTPEERGQQVFDFMKDEKLGLFVRGLEL